MEHVPSIDDLPIQELSFFLIVMSYDSLEGICHGQNLDYAELLLVVVFQV